MLAKIGRRLALVCVLHSGVVHCAEPPAPPAPRMSQGELLESLSEALSRVEGLEDEAVTIQGGSAIITGIADDPAVAQRAEQIVLAAEGVQDVHNSIRLSSDYGDRLRGAATRVRGRLAGLASALPLIPIAMVIIVIAGFLAWLIGRWDRLFDRLSRNPFLASITQRLVQAVVAIVGVLIALEILDATALVGGVLGAAGVVGIAIGFAFRDLVENYIASVLLSVRQPFRPRDHVEIDGHEGLVTSMNSRTTVLTTFAGNIVRIPNAVVFKTALVNYTSDPRRRFCFEVGVGYDVDLGAAVSVGTRVLAETEGVMPDPAPFAIVRKLGDSSIVIQLYGWVDQSRHDFGKVRSAAMQRVKAEFDERDIDMPEPSYKVRLSGQPDPSITSMTAESPRTTPAAPTSVVTHDISRDTAADELADSAARFSGDGDMLDPDAPPE